MNDGVSQKWPRLWKRSPDINRFLFAGSRVGPQGETNRRRSTLADRITIIPVLLVTWDISDSLLREAQLIDWRHSGDEPAQRTRERLKGGKPDVVVE